MFANVVTVEPHVGDRLGDFETGGHLREVVTYVRVYPWDHISNLTCLLLRQSDFIIGIRVVVLQY
jgi:hypothetical protein